MELPQQGGAKPIEERKQQLRETDIDIAVQYKFTDTFRVQQDIYTCDEFAEYLSGDCTTDYENI